MRIFIMVADSFGIGELPDAAKFGDAGSNTFRACYDTGVLSVPFLKKLGLFNIDGVDFGEKELSPTAAYGRLAERSAGKDTTIGHWEIAGVISATPLPTYPNGFPDDVIAEFERETGRKTLCNKPYSGTEVIKDYGEEHMKSGALIVYTSADSVFQIAANESVVPVVELYRYCEIARKILVGKNAVGRVIARPFTGSDKSNFTRTSRRHDYSVLPPEDTMLDVLKAAGKSVLAVGKIYDIFGGRGTTESVRTVNNSDGMDKAEQIADRDFDGICFVNLVDFDMVYGHRNDAVGYAVALNDFSSRLEGFTKKMRDDDVLFVTADHGCDPSTPSTDHSREYVPLIAYGKNIRPINLGTMPTYACIAKTVCDMLGVKNSLAGESFYDKIRK